VVDARAGLRPATADELPIVGRSSTMRGVYYATGHFRNGILLAPLTASLVADLVLEGRERDELAVMRPARFGL
jgi:glycine/D-amino acid oxidase-like deaminating enzyme